MMLVGVAVGLAAAALVGCGGGGMSVDGPTATVPTLPPTTDPYAVPAVIDEAYVNRVLAALDQVSGDVLRLVISTKTLPPDAVNRLKALYVGKFLQLQVDALQQNLYAILAEHTFTPGNRHTAVSTLITARPSCIFAEVARDYSDVTATHDARLDTQWVALVPQDNTKDPDNYNGTPWTYIYDGFPQDLSQPEDPCASVS